MAQFNELVPEIRPLVQKAPIPVITNAVVMATRELCRDAFCYRLTVPRTVVNTADYQPVLPADTRIVKILSADYPSKLTVNSPEDMNRTLADWRVKPGTPRYLTLKDGQTVTLAPAPDTGSTAALGLLLALQPTRAATTIDDEFLEQHAEYIINGAIARLTLQAGQEWYDPNAAAMYGSLFEGDKLTAAAAAKQDNNAKARPMSYGGL